MAASPLQRQVDSVRRRLFLQTLVRALVWSWFAALVLSAVWLLVEPAALVAVTDAVLLPVTRGITLVAPGVIPEAASSAVR